MEVRFIICDYTSTKYKKDGNRILHYINIL